MFRRKSFRVSNSNSSNIQLLLSGLERGAYNYLHDFPRPQLGSHRSQEEARAFREKAQEFRNKALSIYGDGIPAEYALLKEAALWSCEAILALKAEKKKTLFGYMEKALLDHLINLVAELASGEECNSLESAYSSLKKLPDEYAGLLVIETPSSSCP